MKKLHLIILFLAVLSSADTLAQQMPALFKFCYSDTSCAYMHANQVDSMRFVTDDFDVYATAKPFLNPEGKWALEVSVQYAFSVVSAQVGIVPATYTKEYVLEAYSQGKLSGIQTLPDGVGVMEFVCEDGAYKPVAFGLDSTGVMRSHYIGEEVNVASAYQETLLKPLMYVYDNSYHYQWGYGSLMHIRDVMGEEMTMNRKTDYDWYSNWEENSGLGSQFRCAQYVWKYYDNAIRKFTEAIMELDVPGVQQNPMAKIYLTTAIVQRAMHYLDAARMYEYLPTDEISSVNESGNDVQNLTYPIGCADEYAADSTHQVRRVTRQEMADYIAHELDRAEQLLQGVPVTDKELVSESVVYGLKARLYMWVGDYPRAREYAHKAINVSGCQVLTKEEWEDVEKGFNDSSVSSWMWALKFKPGNWAVNSGIINWASWCSNQTDFGYTSRGVGLFSLISRSVYEQISDNDFRKRSFKAPAGSPHYEQQTYPAGLYASDFPDYTSLKFRPGSGNIVDHKIGAVVDVPLMRVEEMYFIRMEASAQLGHVTEAMNELRMFMQNFRDPYYNFEFANTSELIDEIFRQKRVEFFGEGLNYFDYKRLNKPVVRGYAGTNVPAEYRFNTTTRPAWMNFVFVKNAYGGKLEEWNNPDPSNCYTPWVEE